MTFDPKEARALVEQLSRGAPACDGCGDRPGYAVDYLLDAAATAITAALDEIERRDAEMSKRLAYQAEIDSILIQAREESWLQGLWDVVETLRAYGEHQAIGCVADLLDTPAPKGDSDA